MRRRRGATLDKRVESEGRVYRMWHVSLQNIIKRANASRLCACAFLSWKPPRRRKRGATLDSVWRVSSVVSDSFYMC